MIATAMLTRSRLQAQKATKHISTIQVRRACSHEAGAAGGESPSDANREASPDGGGGKALTTLRLACLGEGEEEGREGGKSAGAPARERRRTGRESLAFAAADVVEELEELLDADANDAEKTLSSSSAGWLLFLVWENAPVSEVGVERRKEKKTEERERKKTWSRDRESIDVAFSLFELVLPSSRLFFDLPFAQQRAAICSTGKRAALSLKGANRSRKSGKQKAKTSMLTAKRTFFFFSR